MPGLPGPILIFSMVPNSTRRTVLKRECSANLKCRGAMTRRTNPRLAGTRASPAEPSICKFGSAELRIEPLPESDKDVIGREAAPGGTQGSNRAMPSGGNTGSTNQNKGVEKGKVIPKGL